MTGPADQPVPGHGATSDEEASSSGAPDESSSGPWPSATLEGLRERRDRRLPALAAAALLGLALAWVHWLGLFVAGALVGLASRTLPRALLAGLALGLVVLGVHLLSVPAMSPDEFVGLGPPADVTVAAALIAPTWGALVRGVL